MNLVRLVVVLTLAAVAFLVAAALLATNARPEPEPCNDTVTIDLPAEDPRVRPTHPAPMCAAPEAPARLVLGGGAVAAGVVVAGYVLLARGRGPSGRRRAQLVS